MKIIRDKEKKEKTPEEKELEAYKKAKNIGLTAMGVAPVFYMVSKSGKVFNKLRHGGKDPNKNIPQGDINYEKGAALGLGAIGLGLHGIGAVKYRKLKKKLQEKEKDDNSETKD